jgi:hypothetical protein
LVRWDVLLDDFPHLIGTSLCDDRHIIIPTLMVMTRLARRLTRHPRGTIICQELQQAEAAGDLIEFQHHIVNRLGPTLGFSVCSKVSSVAAIPAVFGRLDLNPPTLQSLAQKHLDFGIDAPNICSSASFHRVEDRLLGPQGEGDTFRASGASTLSHDGSRIEGAGVDDRLDLAVPD